MVLLNTFKSFNEKPSKTDRISGKDWKSKKSKRNSKT
jgi:hypothetical protein